MPQLRRACVLVVATMACSTSSPRATGAGDAGEDARVVADARRDVTRRGDARATTDAAGLREGGPDAVAPHDAPPDVIVDPLNCVPPGTPNNAAGVGGYCSPGGGQCAAADGGTLCTADFGGLVPKHAWFCTNLCDPDAGAAVCGSPGPPCVLTPEGDPVCLPAACTSFLAVDGGADGGMASDSTETIVVDGLTRSFIVHVPPNDAGAGPMPLVLDFHPLDVSATVWKSATTWAAKADAEGFMVVWPQGYMNSWNVGRCCDPALGADVDDVAFTRAMIAKLSGEYSIDPKRIFATGCSNGGGMTYELSCEAADVIAAGAPVDFDCVTGATNDPSCGGCNPSRPISERQFRGTADMDVPYDGGPTPVAAGLDFPGAKSNFATWAGIDDCTGSPSAEPAQPACDTYSSCGGGAEVTLCTVAGGTHCGSYGLFPIVDTAWTMFAAHPLP